MVKLPGRLAVMTDDEPSPFIPFELNLEGQRINVNWPTDELAFRAFSQTRVEVRCRGDTLNTDINGTEPDRDGSPLSKLAPK